MNRESGQDIARQFFAGTSRSYDRVSRLCTFGADRWWKRRMLDKVPESSAFILDQACGTGILSIMMAKRFPDARVVGVDMTAEYLDVAREKTERRGLGNVEFILGRAEEIVLDRPVDCVTSSYLAKYADLEALVRGLKVMLRHNGTVIIHDFTYPPYGPFARVWEFYFTILQSIGVRIYPEWRAAFDGLPVLLRHSAWVGQLEGMLRKYGFSQIATESLTMSTAAIVTAKKTT